MQISAVDLQTIWDDPTLNLAGLSGIELVEYGGKRFLVASGAADGGLTVFEIPPDGTVQVADTISGPGLSGVDGLQEVQIGGDLFLIPEGQFDADLGCYQLDANGQLTLVDTLTGAGGAAVSDTIGIGGEQFIFSAKWNAPGFEISRVDAGGTVTPLNTIPDDAQLHLGDVSAIEAANLRGKDFLFVASGVDSGIESFRIGANGALAHADSVQPSEGGFSAISDMTAIDAGGRSFLVVADAGTDSLLVYRVSAGGKLNHKTVLTDTNDLRIANAQVIEGFEWQGRSFVVAGGGDDGFSVFELTKKGALLHLTTVADDFDTSLDNISAISVLVLGNKVRLFFGSESEHGLTRFSLTLDNPVSVIEGGKGNDTLIGTSADDTVYGYGHRDTLFGEAGNDRLHDGRGRDVLWGGSGADVFVFTNDRSLDKIMDFEVGVDRIDLSAYPMLYHISELVITSTEDGAIIHIGTDMLEIHSQNGAPLGPGNFQQDYFIFG